MWRAGPPQRRSSARGERREGRPEPSRTQVPTHASLCEGRSGAVGRRPLCAHIGRGSGEGTPTLHAHEPPERVLSAVRHRVGGSARVGGGAGSTGQPRRPRTAGALAGRVLMRADVRNGVKLRDQVGHPADRSAAAWHALLHSGNLCPDLAVGSGLAKSGPDQIEIAYRCADSGPVCGSVWGQWQRLVLCRPIPGFDQSWPKFCAFWPAGSDQIFRGFDLGPGRQRP